MVAEATPRIVVAISSAPEAAWAIRSVMSPVICCCSSTAAAIVVWVSLICPTTWAIRSSDDVAAWTSTWMLAIVRSISSVAFAVCPASSLTSSATTAKPFPASPARSASIVALSASRCVCRAIFCDQGDHVADLL